MLTRTTLAARCRVRAGLMAALMGVIIAQTGCGQTNANAGTSQAAVEPVSRQSFYFDTVCQVTVYDMADMSEDNAVNVITDIFSLCADYENILSKTIEGSDIWNVNHAGGEAVTVDPMTLDLVREGIYYGDLSSGLFDITIGMAEDLWDFHADDPVVPDAEELAEAVQHIDYKTIVVNEEESTIQMLDPKAEIDLGGIAKGYIADSIARELEDRGVTSAIISLGGNIETVGGKPDDTAGSSNAGGQESGAQKDFVIGIETPYSSGSQIVGSVAGQDITVVTSGVYERYFTVGDEEYHHILDPETGYPVQNDVLGVSIVSTSGHSVDCDGLSTTCLILGSAKGKEFIESLDGYEAAFITRNGELVTTSGMDFTPVD